MSENVFERQLLDQAAKADKKLRKLIYWKEPTNYTEEQKDILCDVLDYTSLAVRYFLERVETEDARRKADS